MKAASSPARGISITAYNLAAIGLVVALIGLGAAYLLDELFRTSAGGRDVGATADRLAVNMGGRELAIPRAWLRHPEVSADGFTEEVQLAFTLPDANGVDVPVGVTLLPRSRVRASARLLDSLYLHLFEPTEVAGLPGLVGKPLKAGEGYQHETVWYDPLSPLPFVAKCADPLPGETEARCLRSVVLDDRIGAVYAFDARLLANWRAFDAGVAQWLGVIGLVPNR